MRHKSSLAMVPADRELAALHGWLAPLPPDRVAAAVRIRRRAAAVQPGAVGQALPSLPWASSALS